MSLEDKTFMVTGATGGIGSACAHELALRGARLVLVGRSINKLTWLAANLPAGRSGRAQAHTTVAIHDLSIITLMDMDCIVDACEPALSGFVHAAGVESLSRLGGHGYFGDAAEQIGLGPVAFATLVNHLRTSMAKTGSSAVAVSSVSAARGIPMMSAYASAKAATESLVRSFAVELAPKGIRVNAIAAGAVVTPMHERIVRMSADAGAAYRAKHPLGFGSPEDIARAAAFLLSDEARWITGTTMVVDGGYLAKG